MENSESEEDVEEVKEDNVELKNNIHQRPYRADG